MRNKKVAIQGFKSSFHEVAAYKYFGKDIDLLMHDSFKSLFKDISSEKSDYAVVAIENTVAGTILPNYALLRDAGARVIGEVYLQIKQNLMCLPNQSISDIKEVHSHPMAILQCQEFFEDYPHIKLIESSDTALSAANIRENNLKGIGAIASELAAETFNLEIIGEGIETNKKNYTRFLVITNEKNKEIVAKPNKASICFHLLHKTGSLVEVLTSLSENKINLTKIQSLPLLGREWEYFFHLDVEFDDYISYITGLNEVTQHTQQFKILGEYKSGLKY